MRCRFCTETPDDISLATLASEWRASWLSIWRSGLPVSLLPCACMPWSRVSSLYALVTVCTHLLKRMNARPDAVDAWMTTCGDVSCTCSHPAADGGMPAWRRRWGATRTLWRVACDVWRVACGGSGNHVLVDADTVEETTVQLGPVLKVLPRCPAAWIKFCSSCVVALVALVLACACLRGVGRAKVWVLTGVWRVAAGGWHTGVRPRDFGRLVQRRPGAYRKSLRGLGARSALVES